MLGLCGYVVKSMIEAGYSADEIADLDATFTAEQTAALLDIAKLVLPKLSEQG